MSESAKRSCLPCTACCEGWLWADINGHKISAGHPCPHSTPSGCGIYSERPTIPCRQFTCAWLVGSEVMPDWMRPDLSGAIVQLAIVWHGQKVISALPVGPSIPEHTLDWLKRYAREHRRPLIFFERKVVDGAYAGMQRFGYGPEEFRRQVANMTDEELRSGLSMSPSS